MEFNDPVRYVIDHNLSYKGRRRVIEVMTESNIGKDKVYANISNYFYTKMVDKNMMPYLSKYADSKGNIERNKGYKEMLTSLQYLKADSHMDVSRNALVVEDAVSGIESAHRAGIGKIIAIASFESHELYKQFDYLYQIVDRFEEIDKSLFGGK